jgi:hypothetical protein
MEVQTFDFDILFHIIKCDYKVNVLEPYIKAN